MIPRDRDQAPPAPEPADSPAEWATEESVAEPLEDRPGAIAASPDLSAARSVARSAPPDVTPAPAQTGWLASAEGLVPRDAARVAHDVPAPAAGSDLEFDGTRVQPRPQLPGQQWGWDADPDDADPQPALPAVSARSAAAPAWNPFGPETEDSGYPTIAGAPGSTAAPAVPGAPGYGQQPGYGQPDLYGQQPQYGQQPPFNPSDPYGRQTIYGQAPAAPGAPVAPGIPPAARGRGVHAPAVDPRYDPAFQYATAYPEARTRRGMPWRRLFVAFVLGLLLTVGVAAGAIYAYEQSYANRILPNIHVGSVDVSGLNRDTARDRLAAAYKGYSQGTVQVTLAGATTLIPYTDFDRRADIDTALDAAFAIGRDPAVVDRLLGELRAVTKGVTLAQPAVVMDAAKLQQRVHAIAAAAQWSPVDAGAIVTPTGFATTPSKAGQTVDEGTAASDAAYQLTALDAPETLTIALTATPIPPAVTDASAQVAAKQADLMDSAVILADGPDQWLIPQQTVHNWLSFTIINNRVRIVIDTKAVLAELKPLATKIDRSAVNATVKLQGTKIVFDKPSVEGRTYNASKTTSAVVNGLRNRALGTLDPVAPIPPVLALVAPALTTEQAKAAIPLMKEISSWTTNYQPSERNGNGANIRIPTATINGHVVAPGDTFSFWKAVGPVTKELGYTDGGAIIDGHTEPQGAIGGGICSCSTTLFNAVLRAGYAMGDRLNHYYYINRYPLGLDATVFISASGQAQDMTWTNDSQYPVIIQGVNGKAYVKFVLYSVPNQRVTTFSTPVVKNYTKATTQTKVDKTIPRGTTKQIEYATDGQDVTVTRTVTDAAGAVLHKDTYYSHYATVTGIILTNP